MAIASTTNNLLLVKIVTKKIGLKYLRTQSLKDSKKGMNMKLQVSNRKGNLTLFGL